MTESNLPSFDNPPVVEVAMGLQFNQLANVTTAHWGLFWNVVQAEYPQCSDNAPLFPQIEDFNVPGAVANVGIALFPLPPQRRVFLTDNDREWLLQLQPDRFLHNWRLPGEAGRYPRYEAVAKRFFRQWENFNRFLADRSLGPAVVSQAEMTYLNRIVPENKDFKIGDIFPDLRWQDRGRFLAQPETTTLERTFCSADRRQRLRVSIRPGYEPDKGRLVFCEITVRGGTQDDLPGWFDTAHAWIVNAFADLTSEAWHQIWGRTV